MDDSEGQSFPFKDMARRKSQTWLIIFSLAASVSVTIFLVLFGENLGIELTSFIGSGLTLGFTQISSTFITLVIILNSAAGILSAYFLITAVTSERVKDIGIMKAMGCLTDVVHGYYSTELFVMTLAGCLLGVGGGITLDFASVGLMNLLGYYFRPKPPNFWLITVIVLSFAAISYVLGMRRVNKVIRMEPARALSPFVVLGTEPQQDQKAKVARVRNFVAKMAVRDLGRRRSMSLQMISCLVVTMAMITLVVVGGIVANETTQSYAERAVGENVILVGKPEIIQQYAGRLQSFLGDYNLTQMNQTDFLDEKYVIPAEIISNLSKIDGVTKIDARLVLESTVTENEAVIPDPEDVGYYTIIGDHRSSKALIMGVHPEKLVNNLLVLSQDTGEPIKDGVLIGDTLSKNLFEDPLRQTLKALGSDFEIGATCLDTLNNGIVVYMSFDRLSDITKHEDYNVVLLQIRTSNPEDHSRTLSEIEAGISKQALSLKELDGILQRQKSFLGYTWSLSLFLSLFSFPNAIICIIGYLTISISSQQKDLSIMRALGTKTVTVTKMILIQTFLLVLIGGTVGMSVGATIALWFFIPDPVISRGAILAIVVLLSVLIATLCLSGLIPARRIIRTPIMEAMS